MVSSSQLRIADMPGRGGHDGFGYLDEEERQWIRDFNKEVREAQQPRVNRK